jgi:hypothetical protein
MATSPAVFQFAFLAEWRRLWVSLSTSRAGIPLRHPVSPSCSAMTRSRTAHVHRGAPPFELLIVVFFLAPRDDTFSFHPPSDVAPPREAKQPAHPRIRLNVIASLDLASLTPSGDSQL